MKNAQFDVQVSRSPEPAARAVEQATLALSAGDRAGAERAYHAASRGGLRHPASWSNLAALGVALGDAEGACRHARQALQLDAQSSDAWVNFGVASWHAGRRRDAAQAMHHALTLKPGLEAAALNYGLMLRMVNQPDKACATLADAAGHAPDSARLQQALAELARLQGNSAASREHALAALVLLRRALPDRIEADAGTLPAPEGPHIDRSDLVASALLAAHAALTAIDQPFHLIGGTLLAIHRDGRPFPHDKDVDLGLPFDSDRDAIRAAFADGFTPMIKEGNDLEQRSQAWVVGYTHDATGIGVDLMFAKAEPAGVRFELGWPDHLACVLPHYELETLAWRGHDWLVPSPPARYLDALYGPDWNGEETGRGYDRRWFDTQVSNPSRTAESLPRAVNLALLRLLAALRNGQWARAQALCIQIQAREPLREVDLLLLRLRDATAATGHA